MDYKFINTEYIDSVSAGDIEIIRELVVLFKEQAVEIHNEMKSSLASKNYNALALLAHKAKSSVAIMGMNDLSFMLKAFELLAREKKESDLFEAYITRFKTETEEAIKELDNLVNNL